MKSRDEIISDMCYTFRHDYGLDKDTESIIGSGMTDDGRKYLWNSMAQIYDNVIAPLLKSQGELK